MAIRFKYTGKGAFLPELPARDLTDEDVADFSDTQKAVLDEHMAAETRIYEKAGAKPAKED